MAVMGEKKTYPNGDSYIELRVGNIIIGSALEVEGGFLANGRRKPVSTLLEAGKQCLDAKINSCLKEHAHWQQIREILLKE